MDLSNLSAGSRSQVQEEANDMTTATISGSCWVAAADQIDSSKGIRGTAKFYRVAAVGQYAVFHWGRIGTKGDTQVHDCGSHNAALAKARKKINTKIRDGYDDRGETTWTQRLQFDPDVPAPFLNIMESKARSGEGGSTRRPTPAPAQRPAATTVAGDDRLGSILERSLNLVGLAVDDPKAALSEFASINEEWKEIEEDLERARSYLSTIDTLLTI